MRFANTSSVATGERPLELNVTELTTLTEGHPLYLAEVVELGLARGNLRNAPPSIRTTVLERAADLPPETRALLGMASVLGRTFDPAALADVAACGEQDLRARLAPALESGLIETATSGGLRFEHMLVREAFHDALPAAERRMLHEREARRMQAKANAGAIRAMGGIRAAPRGIRRRRAGAGRRSLAQGRRPGGCATRLR